LPRLLVILYDVLEHLRNAVESVLVRLRRVPGVIVGGGVYFVDVLRGHLFVDVAVPEELFWDLQYFIEHLKFVLRRLTVLLRDLLLIDLTPR